MTSNSNLTNYNKLRKFYINLDKAVERKEQIEKRFGENFERFPAVYGKEMSAAELATAFDVKKCQKTYRLIQYPGQIACTLSHYNLYKKIVADPTIADNDFVLIAEDDNFFCLDFEQRIDQILNYLQQERFNPVELVILRFLNMGGFYDYLPALRACLKNKYRDFNHVGMEDKNIDLNILNDLRKHCWYMKGHFRPTPQDFSFTYHNLTIDTAENIDFPHENVQHFAVPYNLGTYTSALYLTRKKALKRIIKKHSRPFWFTDDFKQIFSLPTIFVASPYLAINSNIAEQSDINDGNPHLKLAFEYAKLRNFSDTIRFTTLKYLPFIVSWLYSNSKLKVYIAKLISQILRK